MAGLAHHITSLVRSHASGDDDLFYSVALQVAAREARQGHRIVAEDLKRAIDSSRTAKTTPQIRVLPRAEGDMTGLVDVSSANATMRDLVVTPGLRAEIKQVLAEQRQRRVLVDHGFNPAHRLLLEGPPGTGKTMTASVIATELSLPLYVVRLDSLMSKFMGETATKLRSVFDHASRERAVYLFDEFDALGGDRSSNDVGEARRVLNSFLVFLENVSPDAIVIAATNHQALLDQALFRRFDTILTYQMPTARHAAAVIKGRLGTMVKQEDLSGLSSHTAGLSHAELVRAAETAAKGALMNDSTTISREALIESLRSRRVANR